MADKPVKNIKEELVEDPFNDNEREVIPGLNIEDLVSKTIAKTLEAVVPLIGSPKQANNKQVTDTTVRSRVLKEMNTEFNSVVNANKLFMAKLANTPKKDLVPVRIPKVYQQSFGSLLPVGINGSVLYIPVNNRTYYVPKAYKPIIEQSLSYEDDKMAAMQASGNRDVAEIEKAG